MCTNFRGFNFRGDACPRKLVPDEISAYKAVAARDLLLRNASGGVQEMQCACRLNRLFTLFPSADKLSGAQRRRYTNVVELIGNVDRFLLIRNGA